MSDDLYNVLFLSNRHVARSIFGEAVTNRFGQERFRGFSAGINPAEKIDPLVFDVLKAAEYSTDGLRPKHWEEFAKADAPPLDFVFTPLRSHGRRATAALAGSTHHCRLALS
jgi:arsenate reductase (thioredoxin)